MTTHTVESETLSSTGVGQSLQSSWTLDGIDHPLARLSAAEIDAAREIMVAAGLVGETTRFPVFGLDEPAKSEVLGYSRGEWAPRRVRSVLLDTATGKVQRVRVSLTDGQVEKVETVDTTVEGQPPLMLDEFIAVDEIVKADERWREAMRRRGITDLDLVCPCPLSAGSFDLPGEEGRRMLRALSFLQHRRSDHPWAHPIDGVVAYVDLIERTVVELIDDGVVPIPEEEGNFDDPEYVGANRTSVKPLEITQPDGPSFTVEDDVIRWENWSLRVGFDPREGLILHQVGYRDGERERPVIYRASVAEMVVPYADPAAVRFWQNYFDAGEYLLGQQVNSLALGCDCLGEIHYFDAVLADSAGMPREVENAICLHEEDVGVLWKHTDLFTESAETRRNRRLVISFFVTVGNYDYGFYWYLYLDGRIELEVKSTGVLFTSSYVKDSPWASEVAPGLGGPFHQHMFCARLDMMIDGVDNAVDEYNVKRIPAGAGNTYGNAFTRTATRLRDESEGRDVELGRTWHIINPNSTNRLGNPVGYELRPQSQPTLLADQTSSIARRAAFAAKHLWVTPYDPEQRYPAGEFVNQHGGGGGIPEWTAAKRPIDDTDVVVWHTFGVVHFPRPEDWPIMPVDSCGFTLRPVGFFDRNPTLDVPPPDHCSHD
jgi:primary-amine oxidase